MFILLRRETISLSRNWKRISPITKISKFIFIRIAGLKREFRQWCISLYIVHCEIQTIVFLYRRMFKALDDLKDSSQLVHAICMGHDPGRGER